MEFVADRIFQDVLGCCILIKVYDVSDLCGMHTVMVCYCRVNINDQPPPSSPFNPRLSVMHSVECTKQKLCFETNCIWMKAAFRRVTIPQEYFVFCFENSADSIIK